ncbi:hypothetical protein PMSV_1553 [Photobacterium leiognathi subsp. mandapamensis svers.1.1.]|nr:hypothetical protein PMSV_1553 [Photobacterium leiognathi subsp. mandapamensis svers.1.1.]
MVILFILAEHNGDIVSENDDISHSANVCFFCITRVYLMVN